VNFREVGQSCDGWPGSDERQPTQETTTAGPDERVVYGLQHAQRVTVQGEEVDFDADLADAEDIRPHEPDHALHGMRVIGRFNTARTDAVSGSSSAPSCSA
jgi:hypothetical protein